VRLKSAFHAGDTSSNLVGDAKYYQGNQ